MNHIEQMKLNCEQHVNKPVYLQLQGNEGYSGVIEHVDDEHVYLLVPVDENGQYIHLSELMGQMEHTSHHMMRQYPYYYQPYPNYYGGGYGHGYGYGYGYPRPYNWNRLVLPLAALTALSVLF